MWKKVIIASYNNTAKTISLPLSATYEDLKSAVLQVFCIQEEELHRIKFTDLNGVLYTTTNQSENDQRRLGRIEAKLEKSEIESIKQTNENGVQVSEVLAKGCDPAGDLKELQTKLAILETRLNQQEAKLEQHEKLLRHQKDELNRGEAKLNHERKALENRVAEREVHYAEKMNQLMDQKTKLEEYAKYLKDRGNQLDKLEVKLENENILLEILVADRQARYTDREDDLNQREVKLYDEQIALEDRVAEREAEVNRLKNIIRKLYEKL